MCKYLAVKPCSTPASLPDFKIHLQNTKWDDATPQLSIVDKVELLVPEWKQTIEISGGTFAATTLTVRKISALHKLHSTFELDFKAS